MFRPDPDAEGGLIMKSILGNEIVKTALKWRSYISFITIALIIPLIDIWIVPFEKGGWARGITRGLASDFLIVGNIKNGYFITYFILNALWIHVPFLITLGAGDQLAGEATGGTFRLLLTRPVSRSYILFAKVRDHTCLCRCAGCVHGGPFAGPGDGVVRHG